MKILVMSDSHGNYANVLSAVETEKPDVMLHLGDGREEVQRLQLDKPELEIYSVAGNCDWRSRHQTEQTVNLEGVRILMAHGHEFQVKSGYGRYLTYGRRNQVQILLSGHTHIPCLVESEDVLLMNPGSVGMGIHPSYGVLEVEQGALKDYRISPVLTPEEWF